MKVPITWLKEYVNITIPADEVARLLTVSGMEVEGIRYVGWPVPVENKYGFKMSGLGWDSENFVVAEIRAVNPHPNADRLVLCDLFDGQQERVVLTGAPNLFEYKGKGTLPTPIKVAYAKEGATLYDGHSEGWQLVTLKKTKIRGVESDSMVCSEKELGISEEHEGIMILDTGAPVGVSLTDYLGDAVLDVKINPNMARNANILGIARELAAVTGQELKKPEIKFQTDGISIKDLVEIEITTPELNPRFILGLVRDVEIKPSPYLMQHRLSLAGMRPINNLVDATNYAMLEIGEPLHAFDYDALAARAKGKIKISTRTARSGEKLTTLDNIERELQESNVLVCDETGALSLAGVMGGLDTEITDTTKNVLLEGASWNFINIRRTANAHNLPSEASYRFSRGVHPAIAETGVKRCLQFMSEWGSGKVAPGLVDNYPRPPKDSVVDITAADVKRLLGIKLSSQEIADLLTPLEFDCQVKGERVTVTAPPFRMDIGEGVVGKADVLEEVARMYGYDNIPETLLASSLPPLVAVSEYDWEERLRDLLTQIGLQEVITHRMTSAEREARLGISGEYVRLANPIAPEKSVMRRSLLGSVLDVVARNIRLCETLTLFEIGSVYEPRESALPDEPHKLAIVMTGKRDAQSWDSKSNQLVDFYDLKGRVELLLAGLRLQNVEYSPVEHPSFHPGKCADVLVEGQLLGTIGELHPLVKEKYEQGEAPILAAEFDIEALRSAAPAYEIKPVWSFPPVLEDIALIVDEEVPAAKIEALICQTGGKTVTTVRLFDVYRSAQIGEGKKSLAYSLTYQAPDRTLSDQEAANIRNKIVKRLEHETGAVLRSV
ncbi:MAG: phenylalanine--tRNA ligase subunit beta [Anaerolineales bacterium]|nr:phenylalanine--tRNA ligase subunit beta [Anaerolineales bacterium]